MTNYILSQVFIIVNYLLIAVTYWVKNRKLILIYNFAALLANGVSYFFLSAWSGLAMCGVAVLRNIVFLIQDRFDKSDKLKLVDWAILAIFISLGNFLGAYTSAYEEKIFLSLLSVFATMLFTISVWQKDTNVYKFMGVIVSLFWIAYNIFVKSLFGIICESILLIVEIVSVVNVIRKKRQSGTAHSQGIEEKIKS